MVLLKITLLAARCIHPESGERGRGCGAGAVKMTGARVLQSEDLWVNFAGGRADAPAGPPEV